MLILSLLPQMLMGFKLMHLTHRVRASTRKQLIGDEGEDGRKRKGKVDNLAQSDSVNEYVIKDEWSKHGSTRMKCEIFSSKRS